MISAIFLLRKNTQAKNNILNYLKPALDKSVQAKLNGASKAPFILLVGDIESTVLASLYLHCSRKIDQAERIEGYRNYLRERENQKHKLLEKARFQAHPDMKYLGLRNIPSGKLQTITGQLIDERVAAYIKTLNNYYFINCIGMDALSFIQTLPGLINKVVFGGTIFLEGLRSFTNDSYVKPFVKTIHNAKIKFVSEMSGLFIASTNRNDRTLADVVREGIKLVLQDKTNKDVREKGLIEQKIKSYDRRKLTEFSPAEFNDWVSTHIEVGREYQKDAIFVDFKNSTGLISPTAKTFTLWLKMWGKANGLIYNPHKNGGRDIRHGVSYVKFLKSGTHQKKPCVPMCTRKGVIILKCMMC